MSSAVAELKTTCGYGVDELESCHADGISFARRHTSNAFQKAWRAVVYR